jgi:hypothetical protein
LPLGLRLKQNRSKFMLPVEMLDGCEAI